MKKAEEQIAKLEKFASKDEDCSIATVAVKDGFGYSTDGRILVREKLEDPIPEVVKSPDGRDIPIEKMAEYALMPEKAEKWYVLDDQDVNRFKDGFTEAWRAETIKNDHRYDDRYKRAECPFCNGDVWWDEWEDKLVEKREEKDALYVADVKYPVRFDFGHERIQVNYAYLFLLASSYKGLLVSYVRDEGNGANILCFRTRDDSMRAVLMPLRAYTDEVDGGRIIEVAEECKA